MISTITLVLIFLVAINFILLVFSCNKTAKQLKSLDKNKGVISVMSSKSETASQLAPTGS